MNATAHMNAADLIKFLQTLPEDTMINVPYESDDDSDPILYKRLTLQNIQVKTLTASGYVNTSLYGKTVLTIKSHY
jgi:hypothetical protein